MPRVHIRQIVVLVTCIHRFMIPLTGALSSNMDITELKYDTTSTTVKSVISGLSVEDPLVTICPDYCTCSRINSESAIIARCTELINGTYAKSNIEHFMLEKSENLTLGLHEFHARGLNGLKSIAITNYPNTKFDPTEPEGLPSCISDKPNHHGILDMHPDIFQNNSQLNYLTIYQFEHFMDSCYTTTNYLFDAQALTKLLLSVSNYKCWSSSSFSRMPNLSYLSLQNPNFRIIPGIFTPLRKLIKLEMRHISYLDILKDTFDGINLQQLILAHSIVASLANIQVAGLKYLHIEYNSMKNINKDDFIGMPSLETLIIIDAIETIHEDAFLHLTQLKHLGIHHSNIVSFTENHLRNNFQLEVLTLTNSDNLQILPVFKLNNTCKSYSIHEFECWDCELKSIRDGTFNFMPALIRLGLYKNHLKTLPRGLFKPLPLLESLDLSKNLISNIPEDMFEGAVKLSVLELRQNPLTTLTMRPFLRTPELSILDVSECLIKVWSETISPLNSLRFLSLYGNGLRHISVEQLRTLPKLEELKALDNPIECDDELKNTVKWSSSRHLATQFFVSRAINCMPDFIDEFCWDDFQKVVCDPNYMSDLELIKQAMRRDRHTLMWGDQSSTFSNNIAPDDTTSIVDINNISLAYISLLKSNNKSTIPIIPFIYIIVAIIITTIIL